MKAHLSPMPIPQTPADEDGVSIPVDILDYRLKPTELLVYCYLRKFAGESSSGSCSLEQLLQNKNLTRDKVLKNLDVLERKKLFIKEATAGETSEEFFSYSFPD